MSTTPSIQLPFSIARPSQSTPAAFTADVDDEVLGKTQAAINQELYARSPNAITLTSEGDKIVLPTWMTFSLLKEYDGVAYYDRATLYVWDTTEDSITLLGLLAYEKEVGNYGAVVVRLEIDSELGYKEYCDNLPTTKDVERVSSKVTYAICNNGADVVNKVVVTEYFQAENELPRKGDRLLVRFVNGHNKGDMTLQIKDATLPVKATMRGEDYVDDVKPDALVEFVYDSSWLVVSGASLPVCYVSNIYNVKSLAEGKVLSLSGLYDEVVGSNEKYVGRQMMILSSEGGGYVNLTFEEKSDGYIFSTVIGARYYSFLFKDESVTVTDNGLDILTTWNNE